MTTRRQRAVQRRPLLGALRCVPAAVMALTLGAALIACGGNQTGSVRSPEPTGAAAHDPVLSRGRTIYQTRCAQCHGASGGGDIGPGFTDGKLLQHYPTVAAQISFVHERRMGGVLPGSDLLAVVRYEREVLAVRR